MRTGRMRRALGKAPSLGESALLLLTGNRCSQLDWLMPVQRACGSDTEHLRGLALGAAGVQRTGRVVAGLGQAQGVGAGGKEAL